VVDQYWEEINLGNMFTLQRGYDLPSRLRKPGKIPIVSSAGPYDFHDTYQVRHPGVVTGRYGTIGEVFYIEENFWPLNTTLYVSDFKGNSPHYISYLLTTVNFASHSGKSGVPGINRNDIHELKVLRPPHEEQTAIANALSDVDALITSLEKLIAKKRAIKTAAMQQLLTGKKRLPPFDQAHTGYKQTELGEIPEDWEVVELGAIGQNLIGLTYSPNDVVEHGTLVLRSSNVQKNKLAFQNNVFVDMELPNRVIVKEGDILICVRNGSKQLIGKCALIDKTTEGVAFGAFMSIYRTEFSSFIFYQFQSNIIQRQIDEIMGATINQITNKDMAVFKVPLPNDTNEQLAISNVLSDMDTEIDALEQRLKKIQQLKQGMMQELLTGRTRLL
jgi:type I restriction enzyme S subunit